MNCISPALERLEHDIRVTRILLDISQPSSSAEEGNLNQHLAELTTSHDATHRISPELESLNHDIRVAEILIDISERTFGSPDANVCQHLAELTNGRHALLQNVSTFSAQDSASTDLPITHNKHHQRFINDAPTYTSP